MVKNLLKLEIDSSYEIKWATVKLKFPFSFPFNLVSQLTYARALVPSVQWAVHSRNLRLWPRNWLWRWQWWTFLQYGDFILGHAVRNALVFAFFPYWCIFLFQMKESLLAEEARISFRAHGMSLSSVAKLRLLYLPKICAELKCCSWTVCILFFRPQRHRAYCITGFPFWHLGLFQCQIERNVISWNELLRIIES